MATRITTGRPRRSPSAAQDVCPTYPQRTLAYIANGDLPPLPRLVREAGTAFTIMAALCLGAGLMIGGAL